MIEGIVVSVVAAAVAGFPVLAAALPYLSGAAGQAAVDAMEALIVPRLWVWLGLFFSAAYFVGIYFLNEFLHLPIDDEEGEAKRKQDRDDPEIL